MLCERQSRANIRRYNARSLHSSNTKPIPFLRGRPRTSKSVSNVSENAIQPRRPASSSGVRGCNAIAKQRRPSSALSLKSNLSGGLRHRHSSAVDLRCVGSDGGRNRPSSAPADSRNLLHMDICSLRVDGKSVSTFLTWISAPPEQMESR